MLSPCPLLSSPCEIGHIKALQRAKLASWFSYIKISKLYFTAPDRWCISTCLQGYLLHKRERECVKLSIFSRWGNRNFKYCRCQNITVERCQDGHPNNHFFHACSHGWQFKNSMKEWSTSHSNYEELPQDSAHTNIATHMLVSLVGAFIDLIRYLTCCTHTDYFFSTWAGQTRHDYMAACCGWVSFVDVSLKQSVKPNSELWSGAIIDRSPWGWCEIILGV